MFHGHGGVTQISRHDFVKDKQQWVEWHNENKNNIYIYIYILYIYERVIYLPVHVVDLTFYNSIVLRFCIYAFFPHHLSSSHFSDMWRSIFGTFIDIALLKSFFRVSNVLSSNFGISSSSFLLIGGECRNECVDAGATSLSK